MAGGGPQPPGREVTVEPGDLDRGESPGGRPSEHLPVLASNSEPWHGQAMSWAERW